MWLVLGYGNLLRGDDALGHLLAQRLAERVSPDRARVLALHQLTPELALDLADPRIDRVLFMDARRAQQSALLFRELTADASAGSPGHQLQPEMLLGLSVSLYAHNAVRGFLLELRGSCFDLGAPLSADAQALLPRAEHAAAQLLMQDTWNPIQAFQSSDEFPGS